MKKQNVIELEGFGKIEILSIKVNNIEIPLTTKDGVKLKVKYEKQQKSEKKYVGEDGKIYSASEAFYIVNGVPVNKIRRTEKVKNYTIIDKNHEDILRENFIDSRYLLLCDVDKLSELLSGGEKSIKFLYKKSAVGGRFCKAFITLEDKNGVLIPWLLTTNTGVTVEQVVQEFLTAVLAKAQIEQLKEKEIVVKAEDVQIEI